MSIPNGLLDESADDLFETAPCGYLTTALDGSILRVNRTFEELAGRKRDELLGTRFQDLLTPGGRIYHETHYAPLLRMQGSVREIAIEIVRSDGSNVPAFVNAVVRHDNAGQPRVIRTTVFDATDRRRYEQELLKARRREHEVALELQRGLLAGALREGEGIEVGVAYRPAERGLEVGGDWYDAFWLEEGETLAIVVGDVVGRGLGAAATMGQLRSALRALASTGFEPGPLLEALSEFSAGTLSARWPPWHTWSSTCVLAACATPVPDIRLRPSSSRAARRRSRPTAGPRRSMPTASGATDRRAPASSRPEAIVVLYTDGLIERRNRPVQAGLDELLAKLDRLRDEASDTVASSLANEATGTTSQPDDVCVLALRLGPRA